MSFKDSETYKNLKTAFSGESMAHTKYDIYALKAQEDGFEQMADIFQETSRNEQEHAEIWLKWLLEQDDIPYTLENLKDAYEGETYEWTTMYRQFAHTAVEEGYCEIAALFRRVGAIEKNHAERYETLVNNMETAMIFCKDTKKKWICSVCGHETYDTCSPEVCPMCGHPQAFTEIKAENY